MKKLSPHELHAQRVSNPKHKYTMVVSYYKDREKQFEVVTLNKRELDIEKEAKKIFYRIVKEKTGLILHNLTKPFEQDTHNYKRNKGILTRSNVKAPSPYHSFEFTYCIG